MRGGGETEDDPEDEAAGERLIQAEEDQAAEAAGALAAGVSDLGLVDEMLEIARKAAHRPDARVDRLAKWIREHMTQRRSLERPAARPVHRIRRHPPMAGKAVGRGARRPAARRADRLLHRRDADHPPRGTEAPFQCGPGPGPAARS